MPVPKIRCCLLCDEVRQEVGKKLTLLGFYGVLPRVKILLPSFEAPVDRLTFLFVVENATASFELGFKLDDPEQKELVNVPKIRPKKVVEPRSGDNLTGNVILTVGRVAFKSPGKYRVSLLGDLEFQDQFEVELGTPQDFQ